MLFEILEILMLVCFGISWPLNAVKAYRARTTKGTSLPFLCLIVVGYICGIAAKLLNPNGFKWYVLFFYMLNLLIVSFSIAIYFRNRYLERKKG